MSNSQSDPVYAPHRLRTSRVLRVNEQACEVWSDGEASSVSFAPMFPSPRVERVSPGNLVAVATGPHGTDVIVWRWYDAVVLGPEDDGSVRLWEPGHGEVIAQARATYAKQDPGSRAYASAGLPGRSGGSPALLSATRATPMSNWKMLWRCTPRTAFGRRCSTSIPDLAVGVAHPLVTSAHHWIR